MLDKVADAPAPADSEMSERLKRRTFTIQQKLCILEETDHATGSGEVGAILRREGLYSSALTPTKRGPKPEVPNPLAAELATERRKTVALQKRLERGLDAIMALQPANRHGQRLRKRYAKVRDRLFTFLTHPEVPPDNSGSERELRPTATYRKVTGGFRSDWGADLFAGVRSVIGTAARQGIDAFQAIHATLRGVPAKQPG